MKGSAKARPKMRTYFLVKLMPSGAWAGTPGGLSVQPVTMNQACRFYTESDASHWASTTLRGKQFVVEPMEMEER